MYNTYALFSDGVLYHQEHTKGDYQQALLGLCGGDD